jgi:hypothetical protein
MALSSDDLEQIRTVVRSELQQRPPDKYGFGKALVRLPIMFAVIFCVVLALHVFVIAGFTIYHLMHSP